MANSPYTAISTRSTPQSEPILGKNQVKNNAGGYVFAIDQWQQLERFLILGTENGTYYVSEQKLTKDNANMLMALIAIDGRRVVDTIVDVSLNGRAYKQDPTLFALAVAASAEDEATRLYALSRVSDVCRTGTMLFSFVQYAEQFRGWGSAMKNAVGRWYTDRTPNSLATQMIKYRQRDGWSHRDLLRLAKPKVTESSAVHPLIRYAVGKNPDGAGVPEIFTAYLAAQRTTSVDEWVTLINQHGLPWEALPTEALNQPVVWEALVPTLGITAVIRNLGKMGATGGLVNGSNLVRAVNARLRDAEALRAGRVHPMQILLALTTYGAGRGVRGSNHWPIVPSVVDTLNDAFYATFGNLQPTGKRRFVALDVSGSMAATIMNTHLSCRDATAALALVALNQDNDIYVRAFSDGRGRSSNYTVYGQRGDRGSEMADLGLSARMRIQDAVKAVSGLPMNGTDCSLPMRWAMRNRVEVDTFEVYTDNETWFGDIHPVQALKQYRDQTGIPAKLIVNGMTATEFSIADPADPNSMDVVGFDANAPRVVEQFITS